MFPSSPLVRRFVRSTSAASRRDAERAKYQLQVPNLASKAFFSLTSLALKAYLKARLEIEAKFAFPPSYNPSPQARTYRCTDPKNGGKNFWGLFFRFFAFPNCNQNFASKKHRKKCENRGFWPPKTLPKPSRNPSKIDVPKDMQFLRVF